MGSIRKLTCATCSPGSSRVIPWVESTSYCRSPTCRRQTRLRPDNIAYLEPVTGAAQLKPVQKFLDTTADPRLRPDNTAFTTSCGALESSALESKAGEVRLKVPKLRAQTFETAIIERYRRRESSVEEVLIEMYRQGCRCAVSRTSRRLCGA